MTRECQSLARNCRECQSLVRSCARCRAVAQSLHGVLPDWDITLCRMLCRFWDGIYVLYTYAAQRRTSQAVQKLLSTPIVGKEKNILRHMTFITM